MKAAVYTEYGPPEVVALRDLQAPTPKANEVLVRVHATTVTAGDTRMRALRVPPSYWLPARLFLGFRRPKRPVLGMELAGVIEAVGKDVTRFSVGDQVIALTGMRLGAHAELVCLPAAGWIAPKPANLTFAQAATLCVGGCTAMYFLRRAEVKPGDKVLIYGASGSVGTFAVQLAKHQGAEVTAVCSAANHQLATSLGATRVIDYTQEDFAAAPAQYDVVFDTVGLAPYASSMRALKAGGAYLQAMNSPGLALRMLWTALTTQVRTVGGGPARDEGELAELTELAQTGKLVPVIDRTYPFDQIAEAHRHVDTGRKRGNVAITLPQAASTLGSEAAA